MSLKNEDRCWLWQGPRVIQATIKNKINTESCKHAQKVDVENISEEYKETASKKLDKINPPGKDSRNLWQEIRDKIKESASKHKQIYPRKKVLCG
jgi:hypothetical protein